MLTILTQGLDPFPLKLFNCFAIHVSFQTTVYVLDFLGTVIILGLPCEIKNTRNVKSKSNCKKEGSILKILPSAAYLIV